MGRAPAGVGLAARFGDLPGVGVDGADALAVSHAVSEAVDRARRGQGPTLVVASCYRFEGHFAGDLMKYRTEEEAQPWIDRDPLTLWRHRLIGDKILDEESVVQLEQETRSVVDAAFAWAESQPDPETSEAWNDVYA